jgi:hypothetical protein
MANLSGRIAAVLYNNPTFDWQDMTSGGLREAFDIISCATDDTSYVFNYWCNCQDYKTRGSRMKYVYDAMMDAVEVGSENERIESWIKEHIMQYNDYVDLEASRIDAIKIDDLQEFRRKCLEEIRAKYSDKGNRSQRR